MNLWPPFSVDAMTNLRIMHKADPCPQPLHRSLCRRATFINKAHSVGVDQTVRTFQIRKVKIHACDAVNMDPVMVTTMMMELSPRERSLFQSRLCSQLTRSETKLIRQSDRCHLIMHECDWYYLNTIQSTLTWILTSVHLFIVAYHTRPLVWLSFVLLLLLCCLNGMDN